MFIQPTRKLVLAVDGSSHANAATQFIRALPLPENCQIDIISVLIPRNAQYHVVLEKVLAHTEEQLRERSTSQVHTHLLTGYPAEQIVAFAEERILAWWVSVALRPKKKSIGRPASPSLMNSSKAAIGSPLTSLILALPMAASPVIFS